MKWFDALTLKEQKLIKVGSVIVSIAIAWALIYQPVTKSIATQQRQKLNLQNQYNEMQSSREAFAQQKINATKYQRNVNKPFISWIDEQLASKKLTQYVTRSEPKDNLTIIVTFESIVFDELISWLQPLEQNYGIKISEADINVTDRSNGLCNARVTLEENQ